MAVGHPGHASLLIAVAVVVGGAIDAATLRSIDHVDFIVDTSSAVAHSRVLAGWLGMDVLGDAGVPMFLPNVNSVELQAIVLFINTTTLDDVRTPATHPVYVLRRSWFLNRLTAPLNGSRTGSARRQSNHCADYC